MTNSGPESGSKPIENYRCTKIRSAAQKVRQDDAKCAKPPYGPCGRLTCCEPPTGRHRDPGHPHHQSPGSRSTSANNLAIAIAPKRSPNPQPLIPTQLPESARPPYRRRKTLRCSHTKSRPNPRRAKPQASAGPQLPGSPRHFPSRTPPPISSCRPAQTNHPVTAPLTHAPVKPTPGIASTRPQQFIPLKAAAWTLPHGLQYHCSHPSRARAVYKRLNREGAREAHRARTTGDFA